MFDDPPHAHTSRGFNLSRWAIDHGNFTAFLLVLLLAAAASATTLVQLSLDDMIRMSTSIVRARVTGSYAERRGADIYTHYRLEILEQWKGSGQTDVAVPGGAIGPERQTVAGAPVLAAGQERVLFLWTSPSGLTQVIGLTQGLFSVRSEATGAALAERPAATETMLDSRGRLVRDQPVSLSLPDLRTRVRQSLEAR